jgi:negative regulator of flagellin synthesis FlgM
MRINGNPNIQSVLKSYGQNVKKTEDVEKSGFVNDKVEISDEAKAYQVAMQAAKADSSDRSEKVAAIKAQVNAGTYKVSAEALAEKILKG